MSTLLAEAIGQLNLRPGQTYRTTIDGHAVEVRRLDSAPAADEPSQVADSVMLNLWLDIPPSPAARTVTATRSEPDLPDPVVLDEWDITPE